MEKTRNPRIVDTSVKKEQQIGANIRTTLQTFPGSMKIHKQNSRQIKSVKQSIHITRNKKEKML